jgi:myo-inositol-1(or 4)-monophosphatase
VEEAGGKMSDFSSGPFDIFAEQTLASNGLLHQEMVEVLHQVLVEQGG